MKVKLTLSMNKETITKAKRIAAEEGKSVSQLFEDFFSNLKEEVPKKSIIEEIHELMAPHREQIKKSLKGKSYKEVIRQWRWEDYIKESAARMKKTKIKTK